MAPHFRLNATFATTMARPGSVAFISQSGALCTAVLDWSLRENVGLSAMVSVGSILDVGWGDLITSLGDDPHTRSILIYMESIGDARSFLSAAREVAFSKPIIVVKAGRTEGGARAATSHTGALTGSEAVADAAFRNVKVEDWGRVKRIRIDRDTTTLVEGAGKSSEIQGRVRQLRHQIDETTSDYDREKLQERLAKLAGGVAVVKVGAATETEMKEKKARVEDALHATHAAVEEGVLPGGGVALIRARTNMGEVHGENADQDAGIKIVLRAVEEPLRQIVANAGVDPAVVLNKVAEGSGNFGFNALTNQYGDMVEMGVLDPCKVTRIALQNAASIAGLALTTECMVAQWPEERRKDSRDAADVM